MESRWSQDAFTRAWHFAAEAHLGQKYPGTEWSYLVHIGNVAMEVMAVLAVETFEAPDLALQCALLHDVIEDTSKTYDDVEAAFGRAVADGVQALTKSDVLAKQKQMADSLERIKEQPKEVWLVKLADRSSNLGKPPHYWKREKIARYREEAEQIHEALKEASPFLATRLEERIEVYRSYL